MYALLSTVRQGDGRVGGAEQVTQNNQTRELGGNSVLIVLSVLCVLCRAACRFPRWSDGPASSAMLV